MDARYIKLGDTYMVRLDTDTEIVAALTEFVADRRIDVGSVSGIVAAHDVTLGYYDRVRQEYTRHLVEEEVEIVSLLADGLRNADIAARLFLSPKTVDHHVSAILAKLGARTRGEAAAKFRESK